MNQSDNVTEAKDVKTPGSESAPRATPCYADLVEAANRLARVDDGEPILNVYPDSGGGECSTTLVDTEMLCDAWIDEHINRLLCVFMKVYTVVRIYRGGKADVLYCGTDKDIAEEEAYMDRADEPAPDKDDAYKWQVLESTFPDWD